MKKRILVTLCLLFAFFLFGKTKNFNVDEEIHKQFNYLVTYNQKHENKWYVIFVGEEENYLKNLLQKIGEQTPVDNQEAVELNKKLNEVNKQLIHKPKIYYGLANKDKAIPVPFFPFKQGQDVAKSSATPDEILAYYHNKNEKVPLYSFFKEGEYEDGISNIKQNTEKIIPPNTAAIILVQYYYAFIKNSQEIQWWSHSANKVVNYNEPIDYDKVTTLINNKNDRIYGWLAYLNGDSILEDFNKNEFLANAFSDNNCTNDEIDNTTHYIKENLTHFDEETIGNIIHSKCFIKALKKLDDQNKTTYFFNLVDYEIDLNKKDPSTNQFSSDGIEVLLLSLMNTINTPQPFFNTLFEDEKRAPFLFSAFKDNLIDIHNTKDYFTQFSEGLMKLYLLDENLIEERPKIVEALLQADPKQWQDIDHITSYFASVNIKNNEKQHFYNYLTRNQDNRANYERIAKYLYDLTDVSDTEPLDLFIDSFTNLINDLSIPIDFRLDIVQKYMDENHDDYFNSVSERLLVGILQNIQEEDFSDVYQFLKKEGDFENFKTIVNGTLSGNEKLKTFVDITAHSIAKFGTVNDRITLIDYVIEQGDDNFTYNDSEVILSRMFGNTTSKYSNDFNFSDAKALEEALKETLNNTPYYRFLQVAKILEDPIFATNTSNEHWAFFVQNIAEMHKKANEDITHNAPENLKPYLITTDFDYINSKKSDLKDYIIPHFKQTPFIPIARAAMLFGDDYKLESTIEANKVKINLSVNGVKLIDNQLMDPFEKVYLQNVEDFKIGGTSFKKGELYVVPAMYVAYMDMAIDDEQNGVAAEVTAEVVITAAVTVGTLGTGTTPLIVALQSTKGAVVVFEVALSAANITNTIYSDEIKETLGSEVGTTLDIVNAVWTIANLPQAVKGVFEITQKTGKVLRSGTTEFSNYLSKLSKTDIVRINFTQFKTQLAQLNTTQYKQLQENIVNNLVKLQYKANQTDKVKEMYKSFLTMLESTYVNKLNAEQWKKFEADFGQSPLLAKFVDNEGLIDSWKILFKDGDATSELVRRNPENLEKLSKFVSETGMEESKLISSFGNTKNPQKWIDMKIPESELDAVYDSFKNSPPAKFEAWTPEHKAQRWQNHKTGNPDTEYKNWSNRYDGNIDKAIAANRGVDNYYSGLTGNVVREKSFPDISINTSDGVQTFTRRLDIVDEDAFKGIEFKEYSSGKVYRSPDIKREYALDGKLLQDDLLDEIEWIFKKCEPSAPLRTDLETLGIKITLLP